MNEQQINETNRPSGLRVSSQILAGLLGAVVALLSVGLLTAWWWRDPLPWLTPDDFRTAQQRWASSQPEGYRLEVAVRGRQPATYRVQVCGRQVVNATRDGHALKDRRTLDTWSVPGMLNTIQIDLNRVAATDEEQASSQSTRLWLGAEFDPEYGFPRRYRRVELGTQMQVDWEVIGWTPEP